MTIQSVSRKAGKIFAFASAAFLGIFTIGNIIWAWLMIRPGPKKDLDCIDRVSFGTMEPVYLKTSDGVRIHAWMQWSHKSTRPQWVLLLHGYRSDRNVLHTRRRFFVRRGYHVMLLHFRGHGSSEARPISYGFNERKDIKAAINFIRLIHKKQTVEIGIDGVSMGAAATAYAVAYESIHPDWVILESCYDDIRQALINRLETRVPVPFVPALALPLGFVGQYVFRLPMNDLNPTIALKKISCPALVLAGDSELILKIEEVKKVFQSIPEPKRLVFFPGAGHQDLLLYDPRRFIKTVNAFLKDYSPSWKAGRREPEGTGKLKA